jgi:hypothetical protein
VTAEGVTARVLQRSGSVVVTLHARKHRFKYLDHGVLHSPERLVIDLWKARPPKPAAEFTTAPQGGCLTIDNVAGTFEAVDFSEQDGSLTCIAQVRVALEPAP